MTRSHACAALLALFVVACQPPSAKRASSPEASSLRCEPRGGFSAPNDKGALVDVPDGSSRATVIDLWARWCKGCQHAVPALLEHREQLESDGVRVVLLGVVEEGESLDDARATLASWGVEQPFIVDRGGALMRRYGFSDLPATVVLDAHGNVRWTSTKDNAVDDAVAAARDAAGPACQ